MRFEKRIILHVNSTCAIIVIRTYVRICAYMCEKAGLFSSKIGDTMQQHEANGGQHMQDNALFEDRYTEIVQRAEDILCKQSAQRAEDALRTGRGLPHLGRYKCMIRCRLDAPLRRALERYCQTRGMGICDAIRLAIFALVSRTGLYSEAYRESFWED